MAEAADNAADESAENENEETPQTDPVEEFDQERAMKTIHAQRESEAKLKAQLKVFTDAEVAKEEAEKSAEQKMIERQARIDAREEKIAFKEAEVEFRAQAKAAGIADPGLALLVARDNGLLGTYDPKSGTVSVDKVDFDELLESHPVLAGEAYEKKPDSGDAGRIGRKPAKTVNQLANDALRGR